MFADRMKPEDVGLSPDLKFFRARDAAQGTPTITHTTIYKCPNFSVSLSAVRIISSMNIITIQGTFSYKKGTFSYKKNLFLLMSLPCLADGYLIFAAECGHPSPQSPWNDGVQQAAPRVYAYKVV